MLTLVQFLEELEHTQSITIPGEEVERLAGTFGPAVRNIGATNRPAGGSVEIPMANIIEAVQGLDVRALTEAVQELKSPEAFTSMLGSSSAAQLIDALAKLYLQQFQRRVDRYQESNDPAEAKRLRQQISQELFGA
jgi:hypothetical protein